jgi:ABC-2 type transport system ATP-binding protein
MDELNIVGITKSIGDNILLSDVSFSPVQGEILGLIGPNGAGKTTLLESMAGLLTVDSGKILLNNKPLSISQRKQYLWYQPDDILPYAQQRVSSTLTFFRQSFGQDNQALKLLVKRLDLSSVLDKRFQELSKGYRRRVLLAIALLSRQPLLLLDEPFDGFDLRQTLSVMDLLRKSRAGRTLILSIHQLTEAERICDRFLLLAEGRVLALGTLTELRSHANLPETATLEDIFLAIA